MDREKIKLLVNICRSYYIEELNQQQVSDKYGLSRTQVSRLLTTAKKEGIIQFKINDPYDDESLLASELMGKYSLQDVLLVDNAHITKKEAVENVAKLGASFLERTIKDNDVIGVMAGKFIQNTVQLTTPQNHKNVTTIPLVGGIGMQGGYLHANSNSVQLATSMNLEHFVLNIPAIVSTVEMKVQLMKEDGIKQVVDKFEEIDIALVGIGEITEEATFFKLMQLSHDELEKIQRENAVCSIGKTFINADGKEVVKDISERMIGISSDALKNTPLVVAIAAGVHKVKAIEASLLGGWIDVLVTDKQTMEELLKNDDEKEGK